MLSKNPVILALIRFWKIKTKTIILDSDKHFEEKINVVDLAETFHAKLIKWPTFS